MSIFKKDCPECAAPNPVDAVRCNCGYAFDSDGLATDAEEQDRLYLDYLEARIAQAEAEAIVARQQANAERDNTLKAATALQAEQALSALQAELKQIASRVSPRPKRANPPPVVKPIAKPIAKPVIAAAPTAAHKPAKSSAPRSEAAQFSAAKPKSSTKRSRAHALTPPLRTVSSQPAKAPKAPVAAPAQAMPPAVAPTPKPAAPAPIAAKPNVVAHRFAKSTTPAVPSVAKTQPAAKPVAPQPSAQPNAQFRVVQARKAEAIARALPRTEQIKSTAARSDAPPRREPSILHTARDASTKNCPSCSALVAIDLERCRCGYSFSSVTDVPGLTPEAPIAIAPVSATPTQECPNCTAVLPLDRNACNCGYEFSHADQVPAISLDAGALSILSDGIARRR